MTSTAADWTEMATSKQDQNWIENGEKFSLIGLSLFCDGDLVRLAFPGGLTVLHNAEFELPDFWRSWLGTERVKHVADSTLFLLTKMPSRKAATLDSENQALQRRVHDFFLGLTLSSKFTAIHRPFIATGSRVAGEIVVQSFGELDRPAGSIVADEAPIGERQLRKAAQIAGNLQAFEGPWHPDHWRFFRCCGIYQATRASLDLLDRIHQFTRCIEGLLASKPGETKRQFKSRTELFIGPVHHNLMEELYAVRSGIEHLHEQRYLQMRDRPTRIRLAELEAVSEWIARSCLERILLDPALLEYFGSVEALERFWVKPEVERREIWGPPVDPHAQLRGFKFEFVADGELGI